MLFQYWILPAPWKERLRADRNFIIHCKKETSFFWQTIWEHRSTLNPLLSEQMQVKQSKGEGNKPFASSVVWMAPAAGRWLSSPASALLNVHTHIYNNHSCSHTHLHNKGIWVETETAKSSWQFGRWYKLPLEAESPELFPLYLWQGLWGLHDLWVHKAGGLPSISHWAATDQAVTRGLLRFLAPHSTLSVIT